MRKSIITAIILSVLCAGAAFGGDTALLYNVNVNVEGNICALFLTVSNNSDEDIILQFSSGMHYDFIVKSVSKDIVWQWSHDKMFMQMITPLRLKPGETKVFKEKCALPPGRYKAQGILPVLPVSLHTSWTEFLIGDNA